MIKFYRTQMDAKTKAVEMYLALNDIEFEAKVVEEKDLEEFLEEVGVSEMPVLELENGDIIICDRYADSNIVYQGYGRGLDVEELYELNNRAVRNLWPDITFLLDLPPEAGLRRALKRNDELGVAETVNTRGFALPV